MIIDKVVVGPLRTNCYLIKKNDQCLIIDPGDEFLKIKTKVENLQVLNILLTHSHFDHIGALKECSDNYKVNTLKEPGNYQIGSFEFEIIATPGHKEDAITIYFPKEKIMFTGDFLFKETVGRCDLEGGNLSTMLESIELIKKYPDDVICYPGHGVSTTLGYEKRNNRYF